MPRSLYVPALWLVSCTAQAVELMTWDRLPLNVPLQVGQERVLFIDQNVRVGVPRGLGDKLRIQSTGGTLYLRANTAIEPTRLQLQDVQSGEILLVDIAASDAPEVAALEPIRIVKAPSKPKRYAAAGATHAGTPDRTQADSATPSRETPLPVVLTRYAAQNLYAPLRTVEALPGVVSLKVRRPPDLSGLIPGQELAAQLLGAWQLDDHIVSAVRLQNRSATTLHLDPRHLQGHFISAAFQHPYLGPAHHASDTTVVYLVTRGRNLMQSLLPGVSTLDTRPRPNPVQGDTHEK